MSSVPEILLVEDNPTLGYALKEYLQMQKMQVALCVDGEEGEKVFRQQSFDLCIIDVMLPRQDGFALAKKIRQLNPDMPFIFLTARSMKVDKLKGFNLGADDYIVKPVDEEELVARIRAVLRRAADAGSTPTDSQLGIFSVDWTRRLLRGDGPEKHLTEREASLLKMLLDRKHQLLRREVALQELWGRNDYFNRRSMDVHIARLRKYLKDDPRLSIVNIHGKGFILEEK
jgi:DNA-binding response OmpR family regulator